MSFITAEMHAKAKDALSTDKNVFKLIAVLAFGLRTLIEKAIQDMCSKNAVLWSNNGTANRGRGRPKKNSIDSNSSDSYIFEAINGFSIDDLMPALRSRKIFYLK